MSDFFMRIAEAEMECAAEDAWANWERRQRLKRDVILTAVYGTAAVLLVLAIDWLWGAV